MSGKKLHPSVEQFKQFVKKHPKMVVEVRRGNTTWQDLFEEWYLLGAEDSRWEEFKEMDETDSSKEKEEGKKEWIPQVMGAIRNMDADQLQGHITSVSQALGAIQGLIMQFQKGNHPSNSNSQNEAKSAQHPFQFRKD